MSAVLSILIFNPIEAFIMIFAYALFFNIKIKLKQYVVMSYIIGIFSYIVQYPMTYFSGSILFAIYNVVIFFILAPLFLFIMIMLFKIINNNKSIAFIRCVVICFCYVVSLLSIIFVFNLNLSINKSITEQIIGNIEIRSIQFILLWVVYVVRNKIKSFLYRISNNSTKNSVANSWFCWGEPAFTEKIKQDIEND